MAFPYRNLVFEGGGVKGIAYGGALKALAARGELEHIKRVAGTSAGAINATLMAIGMDIDDISAVVRDTNFNNFQDNSFLPVDIFRLIKFFGWNKGDYFIDWLGGYIKEKTGTEKFTFGNLREEIQAGNRKGFKELYVVATNLSEQRPVIFSHELSEFRHVEIRRAVRMSMSIPLFFKAIKHDNDVMADGGITFNYPINIFDHGIYLHNRQNGKHLNDKKTLNLETLGFRLDGRKTIQYAQDDWSLPPAQINGIKSYIGATMNFMLETANKVHLEKEDWNRTIFIDTGKITATEFDLKEDKKQFLLENGEKAVKEYFDWKENSTKSIWQTRPV